MKRNTSLLRLSSIFMFLTGLAYLAQLAATLILHESQMFLENQAIMLASWLLIVQAVLEILCAVGGFHAAAGRRCGSDGSCPAPGAGKYHECGSIDHSSVSFDADSPARRPDDQAH